MYVISYEAKPKQGLL